MLKLPVSGSSESSMLFAAGGDLKFEGGKKANCGSLHSRDVCIQVRHSLCALLRLGPRDRWRNCDVPETGRQHYFSAILVGGLRSLAENNGRMRTLR